MHSVAMHLRSSASDPGSCTTLNTLLHGVHKFSVWIEWVVKCWKGHICMELNACGLVYVYMQI